MKSLFIVRHGKSSWDYDDLKDIDRPLAPRGVRDANKVAGRLENTGRKPELLVTSPASRAFQTAVIFKRVLEINDKDFKIDSRLYEAETDDIMEVLFELDDSVGSVMIFGHNPSFTRLSNELSTLAISNVPTSGLVHIEFDTEKWTELDKSRIVAQYFDYPKKS